VKFRQQALDKLQAPSELDAPVRLVQPRNVVLLIIMGILVVSGAVWASVGSLPRTVSAPGILTRTGGSFSLQSPISGQITGVFANEGATFPINTPLFTVQAVIERIEGQNDPLVAVLYVTQEQAGFIRVGYPVDLSVQSAPSHQYGVIRGEVQSIDKFPESSQQISDFLGDAQLGEAYSANGQPFKVMVSLPRAETTSGFRWSTRQGPSFQIDSRTFVTGTFQLPAIKPINWVVS
jgi:hypothetical protein